MPWFRYILDPNNKLLMTTYHDVHNVFYGNYFLRISKCMDLQGSN